MLDKLRALGNQLRMPHSKSLGDGLFELRFSIRQATIAQRITYSFEPQQRIITDDLPQEQEKRAPGSDPSQAGEGRVREGEQVMRNPTGYVDLVDLRAEVDASYTDAQRQEYADADTDAETQIALAELVYKMRTEAGISQAELARRMGTGQSFVSALERGGRTPTVATLNRVAHATGNRLRLVAEPV